MDEDSQSRNLLVNTLHNHGIEVRDYSSASGFIDSYFPGFCECLVVSIEMPLMSSMALLEEVVETYPALPVIMISGSANTQMVVDALHKGAFDFIEKAPLNVEALPEQISAALTANMIRDLNEKQIGELREQLDKLTAREVSILRFLGPGHKHKLIAHCLDISEKTVEFHRKNILMKTETKNLAELISKMSLLRFYDLNQYDILKQMDIEEEIVKPLLNCSGADQEDGCIQSTSIQEIQHLENRETVSQKISLILELGEHLQSCIHGRSNICIAKVLTTNLSFTLR